MSQPDGSYPRLNGAMLGSGKYNGKIVSLVGKFDASQKHFECCDKMTVELDTAQADGIQIIPGTIAEIVGLVQSPSNLMVSDEEVCDIVLVCWHELGDRGRFAAQQCCEIVRYGNDCVLLFRYGVFGQCIPVKNLPSQCTGTWPDRNRRFDAAVIS